ARAVERHLGGDVRHVGEQHVLAADDLADIAEDDVVAALAVDLVVAEAAVELVVAAAAPDRVVAVAAVDDVGAVADIVAARHQGQRAGQVDRAGAADHDLVARAAVDDVAAGAADQDVVARPAGDDVVAADAGVGGLDARHVVAAALDDAVVAERDVAAGAAG